MSQSSFPFAIGGRFVDGQSLEFVPTAVRPFGLEELTALFEGTSASITLQCLTENPRINGDQVAGTAKMEGRLSFSEKVAICALVPNGGWLPVPLVSPQHFLLDSNAVLNFRKLRENQNFTDRKAYEFWTRFFEQGTALLNPLPYAFEGNARRIPDFNEFVQAFERGVKEVGETFPRCRVVRFSRSHYCLAYSQLRAMHADTPREINLLCEIAPVLAEPTSRTKLRAVADYVLQTADKHGVDRRSLVVLAALSCLFEDPQSSTKSIGRGLLKPKQIYHAAEAYNAICDLRLIELTACGHAHVTEGRFALCTSDKSVAAFWCAAGIRDFVETTTGTEYTFEFSPELFPRLDEDAISEIAGLLH